MPPSMVFTLCRKSNYIDKHCQMHLPPFADEEQHCCLLFAIFLRTFVRGEANTRMHEIYLKLYNALSRRESNRKNPIHAPDLFLRREIKKMLSDQLFYWLVLLLLPRFATMVSFSSAAASVLIRLLSISGWNLDFANHTARALPPRIALIVIASMIMLPSMAF